MNTQWPLLTHALLRIMTGFLFMPHGFQKLFGLGDRAPTDSLVMMMVAGVELCGGFLIMIGFRTRWIAFLSSGMMAGAYFIGHASRAFAPDANLGALDTLATVLIPIRNGGELAVLYCFVFLFLWAVGSGSFSVDSLLAKRKG